MLLLPQEVPFSTPVLFIIFNRPETTQRVFDAIRIARPTRLYVAADGARMNRQDEIHKCRQARSIATAVDWPCDVRTLFREENLGCGRGVSAAISWFFKHETEGIILEDDCLPSPSFFKFCSVLLKRFRNDKRVMQIGGNNFESSRLREGKYSYRFSNLAYIWGWATWRRAWKLHDFNMTHYKEITEKGYLDEAYDSIYERDFYQYVFAQMYKGDDRTWDYQWQFALRINSGLVIVPSRNLVQNLGFGGEATNTHNPKAVGHDLKPEKMAFPLRHPEFIMIDKKKDRQVFNLVCTSQSSRIKSSIKYVMPRSVVEKFVKPMMSIFS